MKIVHMADTHLGFSGFNRFDQKGRNLMEEMVYQGFDQAIDKILELKPDAVVHAGDVFHHVRPRIRPLYVFKIGLERLAEAEIPVVVISGNHDAPKGYAAISPFYIYEGMKNVHIAHGYRYEKFQIDDVAFHCIPFCLDPQDYLEEFGKLERTGKDVLVMHGLVESLRHKRLMTVGEHELKDSLLKRDLDYIALGHYHGQAQIAENVWYSGSLEYFNFGEARDKKGMLLVDLDRGKAEPVKVRSEYMVDHPPVDCSGLSSEEIFEEIEACCSDADGKMIRITLLNVDRAAFRRMDHRKLGGGTAFYLKIKAEYTDERAECEVKAGDILHIPQEFRKFLMAEEGIPKAIQEEVLAYGTDLMQRVVVAGNTEALDALEPSGTP